MKTRKTSSADSFYIKPLIYKLKHIQSGEIVFTGTYEEIMKNPKLKQDYDEYHACAPIAGPLYLNLGDEIASLKQHTAKIETILNKLFNKEFNEDLIKKSLEIFVIKKHLIFQLYRNLQLLFTPWEKHKTSALKEYKDIFLKLEKNGARWQPFHDNHLEYLKDLIPIFGSEKLGSMLANVGFSGTTGFERYESAAPFYLAEGADVNSVNPTLPKFGTFLQLAIANEIPIKNLIDFIETLRNPKRPNTCFDYSLQDGLGKTPLFFAILTRQEESALTILNLVDKKLEVGIDTPDQNGCTPLMLATALGMRKTVYQLLKRGANPIAKDNSGLSFLDYLNFTEEKLRNIFKGILDPERGYKTKHSYLYWNDASSSPLCLYKTGETEVNDDNQQNYFVTLSPLPHHQQRIKAVMKILVHKIESGDEKAEDDSFYICDQWEKIGSKTILEVCIEGQKEVFRLLQTAEIKELIEHKKEQLLQTACAIGDENTVLALLEEGVNPNKKDHLGRNSLHYSVMRSDLVKKQFHTDKQNNSEEIHKSMNSHVNILKTLIQKSKYDLDWSSQNKSGNTVLDIVKRDANTLLAENETDKRKKLDKEVAQAILPLIRRYYASISEQNVPKSSMETTNPVKLYK